MNANAQAQLRQRQDARLRAQVLGRVRAAKADLRRQSEGRLEADLATARAGAAACLAEVLAAPDFGVRVAECRALHALRCAGFRALPCGRWRSPAGRDLEFHDAARCLGGRS